MAWLTQNWIWIFVLVAAWLMFARRGHHGFAGMGGHGHGSGHGQRADESQAGDKAVDPVSGKTIDSTHAITAYYSGRVYFFENEDNRRRFEAAPADFAAKGTGVEASPQGQRAHRHHGC